MEAIWQSKGLEMDSFLEWIVHDNYTLLWPRKVLKIWSHETYTNRKPSKFTDWLVINPFTVETSSHIPVQYEALCCFLVVRTLLTLRLAYNDLSYWQRRLHTAKVLEHLFWKSASGAYSLQVCEFLQALFRWKCWF